MEIGEYYRIAHGSGHWYHKIVKKDKDDEKKVWVLDLTFPVQGLVKATKSVVEYAGEKATEKEVLDWIVRQIMKENQISIQDKIDEVKYILKEIKKEVEKYSKQKP